MLTWSGAGLYLCHQQTQLAADTSPAGRELQALNTEERSRGQHPDNENNQEATLHLTSDNYNNYNYSTPGM